jgi:methionine-rich copper-binding protein CopC
MKKIVSFICIIIILALMTTPVYAAKKDTTAPTITKNDPSKDSSDIMIEKTIVIRFSEKIVKGKNFSKIAVTGSGAKSIAVTCEITDHLLKITPEEDLSYNSVYTVILPAAAVKDKAGNCLKTRYSFSFKTEKDPKNVSEVTQTPEGMIKYILTMEANLDHELTDAELAEYVELLKALGFDASFTDYHKADE